MNPSPRRFAWIAGGVLLLVAALAVETLGGGYARAGWGAGLLTALWHHVLRCALAAFFFLSAWSIGDLLLHRTAIRRGARHRSPLFFTIVIGLAILAGALFYLAVLGLWKPSAFRVFFLVQCALIAWRGALALTTRARSGTGVRFLAGWPECWVGAGLLALYLIPSLLTALAPPHGGWDDQVYHLALPTLYLRAEGFAPMPENFFAQQPGATELLYAWGLALGDDVVAVLLHFGLGLLACLGLWEFSRRLGLRRAACLAPFLFVCHYMVGEEFGWAYHDVAMAAYLLAAAWGLLAWMRGHSGRWGWAAAGLAAGMVCGSKYTGAGYILGLVVWGGGVYALRRRRRLSTLKPLPAAMQLVGFAAISFLALFSWMTKNWIFTGNPFWPMMANIWGGDAWRPVLTQRLVAWQLHAYGPGRGVLDWVLLPVRVFFLGDYSGERFAGPLAGLPLVAALAGWVLLPRHRAMIGFSLSAFAICFAFWASGSQQSRFLIPALPLLALAGAPAAARVVAEMARLLKRVRESATGDILESPSARRTTAGGKEPLPFACDPPLRGRRLVCWILCVVLTTCWAGNLRATLWPRWQLASKNLAMLAGRESWDLFLSVRVRSFICFRHIRELPSSEQGRKVLLLFEPMGYYANFAHEFDVLDASRFLELAREAGSDSAFAEGLRRRGIVHVLVNHEILKYYIPMLDEPPGYNPYGDRALLDGVREGLRITLDFLERRCDEIYRSNQSAVYRIRHKPPRKPE